MSVKTALRVIEIIETYAREKRALSLSEMARLLDVPVSSCLALIRTLAELGYLYETGRRQGYYPTGRLLAMAQRIARADPVLDRVYPSLLELREATRETIVFAKLDALSRVVYLEVLDSPHTIRYAPVAGEFREVHANSLGKALLSQLPPEQRTGLLTRTPLTRFNARTLVEPDAVEADLQQSRQRGWFSNISESIPDVGAIAWPLSLSGENYSISVGGPVYRIEPQQAAYASILRSACTALEQNH
ncbi:IclR family transcriptional regulator [Bordetella holmesii]|uniref:Transcriptional regulator, IclR family, C-terminal domain protein n=2 Tax=Bordetella holmesii TaxID=35814 RepID=A0A158M1L0_9BORD|nr:IclR family transcriptional regulator [Bordetella holmesii]AHV93385.1 bacterial transcriptional regulator family protein [Bordetella holmesii ATCC 51541]AIT28126.1 bacterial transcriptional regulator family protein [Bordetella holmesii 44057]EWM40910.1 bacterial transcriptional regulator family protein [Bordetella holmesii 35009]EWM42598.1 bacterial transcriptional regulator family protein [Bordetella holmesii 41130]AMD46837.1 IclR family transcriptional regulator [Bordetella holmesii H558]